MALSHFLFLLKFFLIISGTNISVLGCYTSIFSFGVSLVDTGSNFHDKPNRSPYCHLPYGQAYFQRATCCASDGRLIIDYIAQELGLPLVPPYLGKEGVNFQEGVNFAVIGATALDTNFFDEIGITYPTNYSLGAQLELFKKFLSSQCDPSSSNRNKDDYDPLTGCLNWLNNFSEYHNKFLQQELDRVRKLHPHANIIYADNYNAAMQIYRSPSQLGFQKGALSTCCGGGGPYNYNNSAQCGSLGSSVCEEPSLHVSWDGTHLTEAAYGSIANGLLRGLFTVPRMNTLCLSGLPKIGEFPN
ncbi:hypothetical protein GIB67_028578 [Kingdonia uniflora]|uniref:Uncharacterized protein n=1 Tax=Kingdonia uniflora TaxID=39325 RepID=A0A7J7KZJ1_9MAGN|nr:hypothetical protein GIB67_028578 [Kingdonia uniflora]